MRNLWISEAFVNATKEAIFGDSPPYETHTDDIGKLFKSLQREYGKCTGKVYQDPDARRIGWVFQKRMRYEDAHRDGNGRYSEKAHYIREVWVTVLDAPDTGTHKLHFHAF